MYTKLIHKTLLVALISQSLSACGGGGANPGVWANQVVAANKAVNSTLATAVYNNSSYGIELIGCDAADSAVLRLARFLRAGFITTRTMSYAAKFADLDYTGLGIYDINHDADSLLNNSISFQNLSLAQLAKFNCYYRADVPETNGYLYFKQIYTQTPLNNFEQPLADAQALQSYVSEWLARPQENGIGKLIMEGALNQEMTEVLAEEIGVALNETNGSLRGIMINATFHYIYTPQASWDGFINYQYMQDLQELLKYEDKASVEEFLNKYGTKYLEFYSDIDANGDLEVTLRVKSAEGDIHAVKDVAGLRDYFKADILQFTVPRPVEGTIINDIISENIMDEISTQATLRNEVAVIDHAGQRIEVDANRARDLELVQNRAERDIARWSGAEIAGVVLGTSLIAAGIATLVWQIIKHSQDENNAAIFIQLASITPDEAQAWNAKHPNDPTQQLLANGQFIPDSANNNSITYGGVLKFAPDIDADQQIALRLNLSALSSPFVPISSAGDDPYRAAPYDAALQLTLEDGSKVGAGDDGLFNLKRQAAMAQGYTTLAADNRLAAPELSLANGISSTIFKPLPQDFGRGKPSTAVDLLNSSVFLQPNTDVVLNVKVPLAGATSSSQAPLGSSGGGPQSLGNGLGLYFVSDEGESWPSQFLAVKSMAFRQQIDSLPNPGLMQYLYSKFDCAFPEVLGQTCHLTLHVGGLNDGKRHQGGLYVADGGSHTTRIPVLINYGLYSAPAAISPVVHDPHEYTLNLANTGHDASANYQSIKITGLPPGARITANSCSAGLNFWTQCEIKLKFSDVASGNYQIIFAGIKSPSSAADIETLAVNIMDF